VRRRGRPSALAAAYVNLTAAHARGCRAAKLLEEVVGDDADSPAEDHHGRCIIVKGA
jgi:hypothetical protein